MDSAPVLLPYQQRWIADTSSVCVCEKSRRIGLSWGEASITALEAAKANGMDTWYIGYSQDMAIEFIRDCAFWARHYQLAATEMAEAVFQDDTESGEKRAIKMYSITFASGHRVTALSSSPRNLRGKQGRVIIDEAAFHDNLSELLKSAFALLIWGGKVKIISTHNGVDNPFNQLITDVRAGKYPYSLHRITFDDAISQGLVKRVFEATGRKDYSPTTEKAWAEEIRAIYRPNDAEELDVIPSNSSGAYLSRALIEMRMSDKSPVLRLTCKDGFDQLGDDVRSLAISDWIALHLDAVIAKLPKQARSSLGFDFGRSGDLSVAVPLLEYQDLVRHVPFIIEMRNVPFRQQEQVMFHLMDRLPRFNFGAFDARGNGQYLAEVAMQRYGASSIEQVMLTQKWYLENFPKLKAAFEDSTITGIPKDADILDDLRSVVVEKGIPQVINRNTAVVDGKKRHGDAAIAMVLAWFASCASGGPMDYMAVPLHSRGKNLDDHFDRRGNY